MCLYRTTSVAGWLFVLSSQRITASDRDVGRIMREACFYFHPLHSPPLPFLPLLFPSPSPFLSYPISSPFLSLEVRPPLNQLGDLGECCKFGALYRAARNPQVALQSFWVFWSECFILRGVKTRLDLTPHHSLPTPLALGTRIWLIWKLKTSLEHLAVKDLQKPCVLAIYNRVGYTLAAQSLACTHFVDAVGDKIKIDGLTEAVWKQSIRFYDSIRSKNRNLCWG